MLREIYHQEADPAKKISAQDALKTLNAEIDKREGEGWTVQVLSATTVVFAHRVDRTKKTTRLVGDPKSIRSQRDAAQKVIDAAFLDGTIRYAMSRSFDDEPALYVKLPPHISVMDVREQFDALERKGEWIVDAISPYGDPYHGAPIGSFYVRSPDSTGPGDGVMLAFASTTE